MEYRIKELREKSGLTQEEVADAIGLHLVNYNKLENRKTKLNTDQMEKIAKVLGVEPVDLIWNRPAMRSVEVRGEVQAGHWSEAWEWEDDDRYVVPIPDDDAFRAFSLYAVETRGPSMDRRYPEGTVIVFTDMIERGEHLEIGRRYIVERERADGMREATVKTLWRDDAGRVWLIPESSDPRFQTPIPIDGEEGDTVRILGRVVYAVQREG